MLTLTPMGGTARQRSFFSQTARMREQELDETIHWRGRKKSELLMCASFRKQGMETDHPPLSKQARPSPVVTSFKGAASKKEVGKLDGKKTLLEWKGNRLRCKAIRKVESPPPAVFLFSLT